MSLVYVLLVLLRLTFAVHGRTRTCDVYTNSTYGHLDVDFHQYCIKIWPTVTKVTIAREISRIDNECMHPFKVSSDSLPTSSSHNYMIEYVAFLRRHDLKILIVGDFASFQMFEALRQNLNLIGSGGAESELVHVVHEPTFLAPIPGIRSRLKDNQLDQPAWVHTAINKGTTHIVLNTGIYFAAHWSHLELTEAHPNYKKPGQRPNVDELVEAFAAQFVSQAPLRKFMDELRLKHNVTFVWRDLTADGRCPDTTTATTTTDRCEHNIYLYPVFNAIARKAVLGMGGLVIPDVWSSSLGAWQDHYEAKDRLLMHWCLSSPVPIPGTWNSKLYDLLRLQYEQSVPLTAVTTPPVVAGSCKPYQSDAYGTQDMNLHEYCTTEWLLAKKVTISHNDTSTISGGAAAMREEFLCHTATEVVADGSAPTLPRRSMVDFMNFLREHELKIMIVGDSLSGEFGRALMYSLRAEGNSRASDNLIFLVDPTGSAGSVLLAPIPGMSAYTRGHHNNLTSTEWTDNAVSLNITHIVLNTGAWFSSDHLFLTPSHPNYKHSAQRATDDELVAAFAAQFSPGSHLYFLMNMLRTKHNIRFVWRDLAAAGVCTATGGATCKYNYRLFPVFNAIARKAVLAMGGLVIPDVWSSSLGAWQDHFDPNGKDPLHWCLGAANSLPALWNSKLYDLLRSEYGSKPPATMIP